MTYQESFATALRLKNYVRLYDKQSWIYFIFTSETEFTVKVFDTRPADEIAHHIQYKAFSTNRIPMAVVLFSDSDGEVFSYRDPNVTVRFDLKNDRIIYFESEENTPIDLDKVRKSFSDLLAKFK